MELDERLRTKAQVLGLSVNKYIELLLNVSESPELFRNLIQAMFPIAIKIKNDVVSRAILAFSVAAAR